MRPRSNLAAMDMVCALLPCTLSPALSPAHGRWLDLMSGRNSDFLHKDEIDGGGCAMAGGFDIMSNQEKGHFILYIGRRHSTRLKSAVDGLLWYGCMARSRWWRMTGAVAPGLWFRQRSSGWATVFSVTTHLNLRCLNMPPWIHKRALQPLLARRREAPRHRRHLDSRFRLRRSVRHRGLHRFNQKRSC